MNNLNLKNQSGRSMVEMLGVLSVIGVLSVGGIAGYRTAMDKHFTNELLNGASLRAVIVAKQIIMEEYPDLSEFSNNQYKGGTFDDIVYGEDGLTEWTENDTQFSFLIKGVSQSVCENLSQQVGDKSLIQGISPEECHSQDNEVVLYFNNKLNTIPEEEDSDCSGKCQPWEQCSPIRNECICDDSLCASLCPSTVTACQEQYPSFRCFGYAELLAGQCIFGGEGCVCQYACFTADTLIKLANGMQKRADEITYNDELLVWNFDKGEFDKAFPLWIKIPEVAKCYNLLKFSDGSILKTIHQHRIFNKELGKFTYPMSDETPIGTTTLNARGEFVKLVEKSVVEEEVVYYNVITNYHINCFSGNILTSCRLNNLYPIQGLKFVKDERKLVPYEYYNTLDKKYYDGLRLGEQPLDVNRGNDYDYHDQSLVDYVNRLIRKAQ